MRLEVAVCVAAGLALGCREEAPRAPDTVTPAEVRIGVTVAYPGAAGAEVSRALASPIEAALRGLDGVADLRSASADGACEVRVAFRPEVGGQDAAARVSAALGGVARALPPAAEVPVVRWLGDKERWVLVEDASADPERAYALAEVLRSGLATVPGVRAALRCGGAPELQVTLDPARLAAFGLTATEVEAALTRASVEGPAGLVAAGGRELVVRDAALATVDDLESVAIAARGEAIVRLRDVARVARALGPATCQVSQARGATLAVVVETTREVADAALVARARALLADRSATGAKVMVAARDASAGATITWLVPHWPVDAASPEPALPTTRYYTLDRPRAAERGVSASDLARTLELAVSGRVVARAGELGVRLRLDGLEGAEVAATGGARVTLKDLVRLEADVRR